MKKFKNNILVVVIIVLVVFSVLYYYPSNYSFNKTQKSKTNTNSAFVILTRNDDLRGILSSIRQLEDRFNSRVNGGYDYVFLNDDKFDQNFIKRTSSIISTKAAYGQIPKEDWEAPKWIDEKRAQETRIQMKETNVPYGDSVSYRNMCRFNSGKFYNHPLLKSYDYYWRVEPDVSFYCDMDQDPFLGLQLYNASYGFVISIKEYPETIPTLWDAVKEFMTLYPQHIAPDNSLEFISSDGGATYNGCHFWSNFEIGDLNFFRSQAYTDFFNFLDAKGGFYYEVCLFYFILSF